MVLSFLKVCIKVIVVVLPYLYVARERILEYGLHEWKSGLELS